MYSGRYQQPRRQNRITLADTVPPIYQEVREDVEDVMPNNSSAIVALFEEQWVEQVEKALANADKVSKRDVDSDSAKQTAKTAKSS